MHKLILYSAPGCHLCEKASYEVEMCLSDVELQLVQVNIHTDPELLREYGTSIPVLFVPVTKQRLLWPFDRLDVLRLLE